MQTDVDINLALSQFIIKYTREMSSGATRGLVKVRSMLQELYQISGFHQINEPAFLASGELFDQNGGVESISAILLYLHCPKGTIAGTDRTTRTGVEVLGLVDLASKSPTLIKSKKPAVIISTELKHVCSSLLGTSAAVDDVEKKIKKGLETECGNTCVNVKVKKVSIISSRLYILHHQMMLKFQCKLFQIQSSLVAV